MAFLKTPEAARRFGVPVSRLYSLLRTEKLAPPPKDSSGDYVWQEADLKRLQEALREKRK